MPIMQQRLYQKIYEIQKFLPQAWCAQTSSYGDTWSAKDPSSGQCAVSALLVQKRLGGEIVRIEYNDDGRKDSHYFNILPDGTRLDFAYGQFSSAVIFNPSLSVSNEELLANTQAYVSKKNVANTTSFETIAEYVLSFPATQQRYETLCSHYQSAASASRPPRQHAA